MLYLFLIPLLVGLSVQVIKLLIDILYYKKQINGPMVWASGGFPSVHSALSASVTTLIGFYEGLDSTLFALAVTMSLLFRYDAMNVRYESGKHAQYINTMRVELEHVLHKRDQFSHTSLTERIGHTPYEVVGGIVIGSGLTSVIYFLLS